MMLHGTGYRIWIAVSLFILFLFTGESLAQTNIHPVAPKPGLFDTKTDRPRAAGDVFPVKPEGLDQPQHVLSSAAGVIRALVVLVEFPDHRADVDHTPSVYEEIFFSTDTYPTGSLRDYYIENSTGVFDVTGDVTGWYMAPQPYAFYVNRLRGFGTYPNNAQKLVEDAIALADPDVDYSQYDGDNDGRVDALIVVHAGPGAEETGSARDIWSHSWGPSSAVYADSVSVWSYAMGPEVHDDGNIISIGVFCHEFGHLLGLPDLYDCDFSSDGIGNFGLMGTGSWGADSRSPDRPVHMCVWSKLQLGWVDTIQITADQFDQHLQGIENSSLVFSLWTNGSGGKEYFLLTNRQNSGFDSKLPGSGLLIWHIDESVSNNNNEAHKKVDLEEADGLNQLDVYADFNRCDGGDFFPGTTDNRTFDTHSNPNSRSYSDALTGVAVRNISPSGLVMTADLHVTGELYPDIHLSATDHNFGTVVLNSTDEWVLDIMNSGDVTLNVHSVSSTQSCFEISPASLPQAVAPGDQYSLNIRFTPTVSGWQHGDLTIASDDPNESVMNVTLNGYGDVSSGHPEIVLLETNHDFGSVSVGESGEWFCPVYNTGDADLLIFSVSAEGGHFSIIHPDFPKAVSPQETLFVTVIFGPTQAGEHNGQLSVSSNDDQGATGIDVSGTGLASELSVSPSFIDLNISDAVPLSVEVTIDNDGNQPLIFEIGEIVSWLDVTPVCDTIGVSESMILTVTINGSLLEEGASNTQIILYTNDPQQNTFTMPVSVDFELAYIYISAPICYGYPSDTILVPIEMDNLTEKAAPVGGFQTQILYDQDNLFPVALTPTERSLSMNLITWSSPEPGRIVFAISDTQGNTILPGMGPIAHVHFVLADSAQAGQSYWIEFSEMILSDEWGTALSVSELGGLIVIGCKGDMNCDGCINIMDLIQVVNIILENVSPTEAEMWAADFNGDGIINIMDIIAMVENICSPSSPSAKNVSTYAEVSIQDAVILTSGLWAVPIALNYRDDIVGAQFEIAFNPDQFIPGQIVLTERCQDMQVEWTARNGQITILMFKHHAGVIPAGHGPMFYIVHDTGGGHAFAGGIHIENVLLGNRYGESIPVNVVVRALSSEMALPDDFVLMQNTPNPFNPTTDIRFRIPDVDEPIHTTLRIFNMLGQEIRTLIDGVHNQGRYVLTWDGCDQWGREVASGMYLYALTAGEWTITKKMTLIR